jgi:gas vesicle protein
VNNYLKTVGISVGLLGVGVAGGLALGLAAGILLAPRSGRESRESVRRGVGQAVDKGRSYVDRIRDHVGDGVKQVAEE